MPYKEHDHFINVENPETQTIYRYMSLDKFILLLKNKSLYLKKVSAFDDLDEGFAVKLDNDRIAQNYPDNPIWGNHIINIFNKSRARAKEFVFANCWSMNNVESSSMWQTYGDNKLGVCIKTTVQNLYDSIIDEREVHSGKIEYNDSPDPMDRNALTACVIKRTVFQDERELRLWYLCPDYFNRHLQSSPNEHVNINIDLDKLISQVILNPYSDANDEDRVKRLCLKYCPTAEVIRSAIRYRPKCKTPIAS